MLATGERIWLGEYPGLSKVDFSFMYETTARASSHRPFSNVPHRTQRAASIIRQGWLLSGELRKWY